MFDDFSMIHCAICKANIMGFDAMKEHLKGHREDTEAKERNLTVPL